MAYARAQCNARSLFGPNYIAEVERQIVGTKVDHFDYIVCH